MAQQGERGGHPFMLAFGQRQHLGCSQRDHADVADVPVIALRPDPAGRGHLRAVCAQPVAKADHGIARRDHIGDQIGTRGGAAGQQIVIPADDPGRRHRAIGVVVIDPVAVFQIVERQIGEITRNFGQVALRRGEQRRHLPQARAQLGNVLLAARHFGKCDRHQRIEIEARITLPRPQDFEIETIAV